MITCDGLLHHYMGNCEHLLLGSCSGDASFPFAIYGTNVVDQEPDDPKFPSYYSSTMREMRIEYFTDVTIFD